MPTATVAARLGPIARPESRSLLLATTCALAVAAVDLALPWPLAIGIDAVVDERSFVGLSPSSTVLAAGVALVVLTSVSALLDLCTVVTSERAAERVGARLRGTVFEHVITRSLRWHDATPSGETVSRITSDTGRVLDALVALSCTLLPDLVRLGLVLVVLLLLEPVLAVIALVALPFMAVLAVRQRRLVRAAQSDAREVSGRLSAVTVDLLRNVRAIQAFGLDRHVGHTFAHHNTRMRDANSRAISIEARWAPAADVILALGMGATLVVGGRLVIAGRLSPGDIVVATAYVSALYSPVRALSRLSGVLAKSSVSAKRIVDVLDNHDAITDTPSSLGCPPVRDAIRFESVRFGYEPGRPVLDDFDLTLPAGTSTCLFGPSGTGKSTVLNLLLRLYDVDAGRVTIDGRDIRTLSVARLRRQIAFVPQDPWLFDATIEENIRAGSNASWHDVLAAAQAAHAHEFIVRTPEGYGTVLGENGVRLSGGQRRRIALARALLSPASVLVLDEPTSSLDAASADAVVAAMRSSRAGRTVVLVTHDEALAAQADRVIRLDRARRGELHAIHPIDRRREVTTP